MRAAVYSPLCAMALTLSGAAISQSQDVTIPLRGVLPLRCEARILNTKVNLRVNLTVDAQVKHRCNSGHVLTVSHQQVRGQRAGDVSITYDGMQPTSITSTSASFSYGPVLDGTRPVRVVFTLGTRGANPSELAQTIRVEVAPH